MLKSLLFPNGSELKAEGGRLTIQQSVGSATVPTSDGSHGGLPYLMTENR
jgi:hypothetical protein